MTIQEKELNHIRLIMASNHSYLNIIIIINSIKVIMILFFIILMQDCRKSSSFDVNLSDEKFRSDIKVILRCESNNDEECKLKIKHIKIENVRQYGNIVKISTNDKRVVYYNDLGAFIRYYNNRSIEELRQKYIENKTSVYDAKSAKSKMDILIEGLFPDENFLKDEKYVLEMENDKKSRVMEMVYSKDIGGVRVRDRSIFLQYDMQENEVMCIDVENEKYESVDGCKINENTAFELAKRSVDKMIKSNYEDEFIGIEYKLRAKIKKYYESPHNIFGAKQTAILRLYYVIAIQCKGKYSGKIYTAVLHIDSKTGKIKIDGLVEIL